MSEQIINDGLGTICVAGGYTKKQNEEVEQADAETLAKKHYEKFFFVPRNIVENPTSLLSANDLVVRQTFFYLAWQDVNHLTIERLAVFGSNLTGFMTEVINVSCQMRKPIDFYVTPGSILCHYAHMLSRKSAGRDCVGEVHEKKTLELSL